MKGLKCWVIGELIGQYMEDQLSDKDNKIVLNHIQSCNRCKKELQEMKELKKILITASVLPCKPDAFWEEIENNIIREISNEMPLTYPIVTTIPELFQNILYDFRKQLVLNTAILLYSILCNIAPFFL